MIQVNNISKSYGPKKAKIQALQEISFEVSKGEVFGLIGPDGAGKTTLFRILTTLLLPDSGSALVDGLDIVKDYKTIRNRVGYMPGKFSLYQDLTVRENIEFFATIFKTTVSENYDYVKEIYAQIEPFENRKAGKLSGGMKQKLALSCALIHRPVVLFLDEPTTGVDAVSRKEFWQMLQRLKQQGITILVSTPYMDEAALCDRVALIQSGNIMSVDKPAGIVAQFRKKLVAAKGEQMLPLLKTLKQCAIVEDAYPFGEYHHVIMKSGGIDELMECVGNKPGIQFKEAIPGIEDCFMELMRHNGN